MAVNFLARFLYFIITPLCLFLWDPQQQLSGFHTVNELVSSLEQTLVHFTARREQKQPVCLPLNREETFGTTHLIIQFTSDTWNGRSSTDLSSPPPPSPT